MSCEHRRLARNPVLALERWQDAVARTPGPRPEAARWLTVFDAFASEPWRIDRAPGLYDGLEGPPS